MFKFKFYISAKYALALLGALLLAQQVSLCQASSRVARPVPQKKSTGWHIGSSFGITINTVEMDFSDKPFWRPSYVGGWQYPGLEAHYSLAPRVLATFGLNVLQRGQRVETIQKFEGINDFTLMRTYLNLPAGIAIELFDSKFSPYVSAGAYGAYWLSGKWTGSVYQILGNPYDENYNPFEPGELKYEAPYEFSSGKDVGIKENRAEFGVWGGGGLKYRTNGGIRLFMGFQATVALTSIYSSEKEILDFQKRRNAGYLLNAGLTFPINK